MAPCLRYNKRMKKTKNKIITIKNIFTMLIFMLSVCLVTACGAQRGQEASETDVRVRVGVIDTGFSEKAIPADNIYGGRNYVDEGIGIADTYGHGTAVAGIILEQVPDAELVALVSSVYDHGKLTQVDADAFAGIIMDAVDVYECDVINVSLGFAADVETVRSAVEHAHEKGVVIVAAAGNDYAVNSGVKYYPAAYDTVIAVGSLNEELTQIADFSQRGGWVNGYEKGENVTVRTLSGSTRTVDGTSYSAAAVTAKAAKLLKEDPGLTPEQVLERIDFTAY